MGYTHYWSHKAIPSDVWSRATAAVNLIFACTHSVCEESDTPEAPPIANDELICFNGKDDDGHETFVIEPSKEDFSFCKTNLKEYDAVVCACLIALRVAAPNQFTFSSDGDVEQWQEGIDLYNRACRGSITESDVMLWLRERA